MASNDIVRLFASFDSLCTCKTLISQNCCQIPYIMYMARPEGHQSAVASTISDWLSDCISIKYLTTNSCSFKYWVTHVISFAACGIAILLQISSQQNNFILLIFFEVHIAFLSLIEKPNVDLKLPVLPE